MPFRYLVAPHVIEIIFWFCALAIHLAAIAGRRGRRHPRGLVPRARSSARRAAPEEHGAGALAPAEAREAAAYPGRPTEQGVWRRVAGRLRSRLAGSAPPSQRPRTEPAPSRVCRRPSPGEEPMPTNAADRPPTGPSRPDSAPRRQPAWPWRAPTARGYVYAQNYFRASRRRCSRRPTRSC